MGQKQCEKCGEVVDEAKAFCPGCGNAFVEELTRESVSDFDQSKHTVQLGQTMYNQLLSDMGLNLQQSGQHEKQKRTEVIAPAVTAQPEAESKPAAEPASKISTSTILIIAGLALLVLGAIVVVIAAAAALYFLRA